MGSTLSAISEDTADYLQLCQHYGEPAERDESGANPYGPHAEKLKARAAEDCRLSTLDSKPSTTS